MFLVVPAFPAPAVPVLAAVAVAVPSILGLTISNTW
jgi:hypothetical protein